MNLKGIAVAALAPLWELISSISTSFRHVSDVKVTHEDGTEKYAQEEIDRLKLENQLLANEVLNLTDILKNEALIALQVLDKDSDTLSQRIDMLQLLREQDFSRLLSLQLSSIPAQVIFRSPGSWTNSFWVNVGAADNDSLQNDVIVKNSPVVVGTSIAGVIDYVGKHQSRVRMITDSGLCCSVRVMRIVDKQAKYLAKGELRGSVEAVWRGLSPVLRGVGFNYDYADEDGPFERFTYRRGFGGSWKISENADYPAKRFAYYLRNGRGFSKRITGGHGFQNSSASRGGLLL